MLDSISGEGKKHAKKATKIVGKGKKGGPRGMRGDMNTSKKETRSQKRDVHGTTNLVEEGMEVRNTWGVLRGAQGIP